VRGWFPLTSWVLGGGWPMVSLQTFALVLFLCCKISIGNLFILWVVLFSLSLFVCLMVIFCVVFLKQLFFPITRIFPAFFYVEKGSRDTGPKYREHFFLTKVLFCFYFIFNALSKLKPLFSLNFSSKENKRKWTHKFPLYPETIINKKSNTN